MIVVVIAIWLACALAGWKLMESKGRDPFVGGLLGLLLGVFGILICAFFSKTDKKRAEEVARLRAIYRD